MFPLTISALKSVGFVVHDLQKALAIEGVIPLMEIRSNRDASPVFRVSQFWPEGKRGLETGCRLRDKRCLESKSIAQIPLAGLGNTIVEAEKPLGVVSINDLILGMRNAAGSSGSSSNSNTLVRKLRRSLTSLETCRVKNERLVTLGKMLAGMRGWVQLPEQVSARAFRQSVGGFERDLIRRR